MKGHGWRLTVALLALACVSANSAAAAIEIPKVSGKALGVTRGKQFGNGVVFIEGKYIEPPYVVERWGNGIRINGIPVVSQVVDWTDFLKTQSSLKVVKTESAPSAAPTPPPVQETYSADVESSLDDLFDDEPKAKPVKKAVVRPAAPPRPKTTVSYSLEGGFVRNEASNLLVKRINAVRTEIDRTLRTGGFFCFGADYARVSGDQRETLRLLDRLPDFQRRCESVEEFVAAVRSAKLVYLTEPICRDFFKNRIDYRKLQDRRRVIKEEAELEKLVNGVAKPLF